MSSHRFLSKNVLAIWLVLITALGFASQATAKTLVVGVVSSKPEKQIRYTQPLADYLAANLSELGYTSGEVKVTPDLEQMGQWLVDGQVDMVSETVFAALELQENYGAKMLLRRWKKGVSQYASVLFTRKDANIGSIDDLLGKVIAFEDRGSTSSYYIPASLLVNLGYDLVEVTAFDQSVPEDKIGFIFAEENQPENTEISLSDLVHNRNVAAGAFSNLDFQSSDISEAVRQGLDVIYESVPFPRGVQLVRPGLDPQTTAALKQILMNAHETEEGQQALQAFQKTKKFDVLDGEMSRSLTLAVELRMILETML